MLLELLKGFELENRAAIAGLETKEKRRHEYANLQEEIIYEHCSGSSAEGHRTKFVLMINGAYEPNLSHDGPL